MVKKLVSINLLLDREHMFTDDELAKFTKDRLKELLINRGVNPGSSANKDDLIDQVKKSYKYSGQYRNVLWGDIKHNDYVMHRLSIYQVIAIEPGNEKFTFTLREVLGKGDTTTAKEVLSESVVQIIGDFKVVDQVMIDNVTYFVGDTISMNNHIYQIDRILERTDLVQYTLICNGSKYHLEDVIELKIQKLDDIGIFNLQKHQIEVSVFDRRYIIDWDRKERKIYVSSKEPSPSLTLYAFTGKDGWYCENSVDGLSSYLSFDQLEGFYKLSKNLQGFQGLMGSDITPHEFHEKLKEIFKGHNIRYTRK